MQRMSDEEICSKCVETSEWDQIKANKLALDILKKEKSEITQMEADYFWALTRGQIEEMKTLYYQLNTESRDDQEVE
jgi:uncharacterized protein (DUF305 family)